MGGANVTEGRVEVNYNGTWGTVCDDSWTIQDANVVCRQLGFTRATAAFSFAYFGAGTGAILLDDVTCFGTEARLDQCLSAPFGEHNCRHYEDAGVRCYGMFLVRFYKFLSSKKILLQLYIMCGGALYLEVGPTLRAGCNYEELVFLCSI